MGVTSRADDVQCFDTRWDEVLLSTHGVPSDSILEGLYKMRIHESDQLNTVMALYEQDIAQKNMLPSCRSLKTIQKENLSIRRQRLTIFEARNEGTVTGTPAKKQKQREVSQG